MAAVDGPILFTERMILRPLRARISSRGADDVTMRHLGGPQDRGIAWRGLCAMAGAWQVRGFSMFACVERTTGKWVGRVGPWMPEGWPGTEVGWGVARAFAGKGYAHEAAVATIDYDFDVLGWDEVIHTIAPDNKESAALAARLGSTNRGPIRLPPPLESFPVEEWGQSAARWRARRKA